MDIIAKSKYIRISPRKMRLVARGIKKESNPIKVLALLSYADKKAALPLSKTIKQAVSNAKNNFSKREEDLRIKCIDIGDGPTFKRFQPISRGMAHSIFKRTSHITVVLEAREPKQKTETKKDIKKEEKKKEGKNGTKG